MHPNKWLIVYILATSQIVLGNIALAHHDLEIGNTPSGWWILDKPQHAANYQEVMADFCDASVTSCGQYYFSPSATYVDYDELFVTDQFAIHPSGYDYARFIYAWTCPKGLQLEFIPTAPEDKPKCLSLPHFFITPDNLSDPCDPEGNPCDPTTGNKTQTETDLQLSNSGLEFQRHYSSQTVSDGKSTLGLQWQHSYHKLMQSYQVSPNYIDYTSLKSNEYNDPFSACQQGWDEIKATAFNGLLSTTTATYQDNHCKIKQNGITVATNRVHASNDFAPPSNVGNTLRTISRPNGTVYTFEQQAGQWITTTKAPVNLEQVGSDWHFTDLDDTVEVYDAAGKLLSSTTRNGLVTTLSYNPDDTLDQVTDPYGHTLTFAYDTNGRIDSLTTSQGLIGYRYDSNNNLEYVDYPDNTTKQYHYEDTNHPHHLTGITDERGIRYATWAYDVEGRAILSEHAGGVEQVTFTYNPDSTTTVQTGEGAIRTYNFEVNHGVMDVTGIAGDLCSTCPNGDKKDRSYDANGYLANYTDWSNAITELGNYDALGQFGFKIEAKSTSEERRIDYTYDPRFYNKVTTTIEPSVSSQ